VQSIYSTNEWDIWPLEYVDYSMIENIWSWNSGSYMSGSIHYSRPVNRGSGVQFTTQSAYAATPTCMQSHSLTSALPWLELVLLYNESRQTRIHRRGLVYLASKAHRN
jgi:hypothetical protein